jgi:hypothetical protein
VTGYRFLVELLDIESEPQDGSRGCKAVIHPFDPTTVPTGAPKRFDGRTHKACHLIDGSSTIKGSPLPHGECLQPPGGLPFSPTDQKKELLPVSPKRFHEREENTEDVTKAGGISGLGG